MTVDQQIRRAEELAEMALAAPDAGVLRRNLTSTPTTHVLAKQVLELVREVETLRVREALAASGDDVRLSREYVAELKAYLVRRNTYGGLNALIQPLARALAAPPCDVRDAGDEAGWR